MNELKSFRADLERELRDSRSVIDRVSASVFNLVHISCLAPTCDVLACCCCCSQLELELRSAREKSSLVYGEKSKYEESMRTLQQSNVMTHSQVAELQVRKL